MKALSALFLAIGFFCLVMFTDMGKDMFPDEGNAMFAIPVAGIGILLGIIFNSINRSVQKKKQAEKNV
jgi:mannose/fructose/N-acetylgalactosamine-specific phosphotransferase system component IIC